MPWNQRLRSRGTTGVRADTISAPRGGGSTKGLVAGMGSYVYDFNEGGRGMAHAPSSHRGGTP